MSDERLRELERRWRESGSVEDEAAWLRARVQAGEVEQRKLELGAMLRHPAALAATSSDRTLPTTVSKLVEKIAGEDAQIRSALAALRTAWTTWSSIWSDYPTGVTAFYTRLHAAEEWVACPCARHQLGVETAMGRRVFISLEHVIMRAGEVDEGLLELAEGIVLGWSQERAQSCLSLATAGTAGPAFQAQVLEPVQAELVPWALGYADPVREGVEARQRETAGD